MITNTPTPRGSAHKHPGRRPGSRRFGLSAIVLASTTLIGLTACGSDSKSTSTTAKTTVTTEKAPTTTVADTKAPSTTDDTTVDTKAPSTTEDTTADAEDTTVDTEDTIDTTVDTTDTIDTTVDTEDTIDTTDDTSTGDTSLSNEDLEAAIKTLLLTPEEVGPTFVEDTYTPGDGTTPCGINVDGQVPAVVSTGTQIDSAEPLLAMIEEIKVYDTEESAQNAFDLATTGFACGSAAEAVQLGDLTDVSSDLGVKAFAVPISSEDAEGVLFIALEKDSIVVLQFQQEAGAEEVPGIPDPTTLATAAITKIETFLAG